MKILLNNKTSFLIYKRNFEKLFKIAQKHLLLDMEEMSLALIVSKEMQEINRMYRGADSPTDVLAFGYGEILLCPAYIKKKYRLKTKPEVVKKMGELFIHGLSHIAGYTHETEEKEREMREVEFLILNS